jgi:hypothetical protein
MVDPAVPTAQSVGFLVVGEILFKHRNTQFFTPLPSLFLSQAEATPKISVQCLMEEGKRKVRSSPTRLPFPSSFRLSPRFPLLERHC